MGDCLTLASLGATVEKLPPRLGRLLRAAWEPANLALLTGMLLYVFYWASVSVTRFYGLTSAVYDLGVTFQHAWIFTQPGLPVLYSLKGLPNVLAYIALAVDQPFELLLSPVTFLHSYPAFLILQSLALGSGALPLFLLGRQILSSKPAALVVSFAYLLYFPLGGVNWFDVHFLAFFVPLFLWAYYFFHRRSYWTAGLLFFLAGTTEFPVMGLVTLFSLSLLLEALYRRFSSTVPVTLSSQRFALVLLVASTAFLAYQLLYINAYLGFTGLSATLHTGGTGGVGITSPSIPFVNRATVVLLILAPVGFLTLLSPRWTLMLAPTAFLVFGTTYFGYSFPSIFRSQYSAIFIPFVFLGTVFALRSLDVLLRRSEQHPPLRSRIRRHARAVLRAGLLATLIVLALVFASIFQPFGPFNPTSQAPLDIPEINSSAFGNLTKIESVIPRTTPYVLFQNDMPGMLPRPLEYLDTPLVSGIGDWRAVTPANATAGRFPLTLFTGQTVEASVLYAVDDPYNWGFSETGDVANNSMYHFISDLYGSGMYGILGEESGMLALERNYSGRPLVYSPYDRSYPASQLWVPLVPQAEWNNTTWNGPKGPSGLAVISATNASLSHAWDGPYTVLSPGWYDLNYSLLTTNRSASNYVTLFAIANYGKTPLKALRITGANFTSVGTWTNFGFRFYVNNTYEEVAFPGLSIHWSGTLSVRSITLAQISPGTPLFSPDGA